MEKKKGWSDCDGGRRGQKRKGYLCNLKREEVAKVENSREKG